MYVPPVSCERIHIPFRRLSATPARVHTRLDVESYLTATQRYVTEDKYEQEVKVI